MLLRCGRVAPCHNSTSWNPADVETLPVLLQAPLLKTADGTVEGLRSGGRSAIIFIGKQAYRLKGWVQKGWVTSPRLWHEGGRMNPVLVSCVQLRKLRGWRVQWARFAVPVPWLPSALVCALCACLSHTC